MPVFWRWRLLNFTDHYALVCSVTVFRAPRIQALVSRFSRMIIWELILAGLLLASVSVLNVPAACKNRNSHIRSEGFQANVDDLKINVNITPGHIGQNTFTLQLTSNGQPVHSVRKSLIAFHAQSG